MPKFTSAERTLIKSITSLMLIKRLPDREIINEIHDRTHKSLTSTGLFLVKQALKKDSYYWLKTMRQDQYAYIHEFKECINEILDLQKKHHEIVDSPTVPIPIKQTSLSR